MDATELASATSTQVLTLATGLLALTATIGKDHFLDQNKRVPPLMRCAWCVLLVSVLGGVWTLMGITGSAAEGRVNIYAPNIRIPALMQMLCFVVGLCMVMWVGARTHTDAK